MKKSIFLFFAAILCATSAWAADVAKNTIIYFDNSVSQWNYQFHYFTINDDYGWKMTKVDNTLLYVHKRTANTWGGYSKVRLFATDGDWGNDKSLCGGENNMKQHGANLTKTVTNYGFNADQYYTLKPDKKGSSSSQANLTAGWIGSSLSAMNKTITVKAKVSTDKGATYAEKTSPGTLTASSFKFTAYNSCKSATSLSSGKITCGYTANTTLTAQTDVEGYVFAGWYDKDGTRQTADATLTINPTADATYYAYYTAELKHDVKITWVSGTTELQTSQTIPVGEETPYSVEAPKVKDYTFSGWILGSGIKSADENANPISIRTLSAGEYTLTANYEYIEPVIKTIYCKMEHGWWTQGDAAISAYASGTEGEMKSGLGTLMTLAPWESNVWKLDIDIARYQKVQFIRVSKDGKNDYNARTAVLDIPTDTKDLYTITQSTDMWYNGSYTCSGEWSTYTPTAVPDRYLTGNAAGFGMTIDGEGNEQWSPNTIKMTWNDATQKFTHTVSGLEANKYYKFRITDGTWVGKWGYSNLKSAIENVFGAEDNNISFVLAADGDLTITFDGTYIELTTTSSFAAPVYTIVGDAAVTGCHWDVNSVENQMVQDAIDKNQFTLVKTVTAVAGEYEYKAIRNHSYDWEVASGTKLTIEKDGTGTITYTLDVSTKTLTAVVSDWVEGSVAQEVTLVGIGEDKEFTEEADHKTTSVAVELEANSVYTFEVVVNSVYMKNNGTMWRGNCTNWTFKSEENNAHIVTDIAGTYTFTWTYEGNKLSVTYPDGTNVPAPVFLGGDMNEWSWTKTRLIPSVDGKTASATINLTDVKTYNFKIKVGDTYLGNNGEMNREYHENWIFREKDGENDEKNAQITTDIIGNYTFTWTYETNALTVTYPEMVTEPETYTRTVTPGNYGTICLPYASSSHTGMELYVVSWLQKNGETPVNLYLDQLEADAQLEAGKPYIFRATSTELTVTYTGEVALAPIPGENGLTGSFDAIPAGGVLTGNYVIAQNKFWTATAEASAPANRAYINPSQLPTSEPAKLPGRRRVALGAAGENEATGMDNITTTDTPVKVIENGQLIIIRDGVKYNVQGQKL